MTPILAATFEPPSTKGFVFGCIGPSLGGLCVNFIIILVALAFLVFVLLFYFAFRAPTVVPGKLQSVMEAGIAFVREQVALPMLGHDADRFLALLATLFFFILLGNLFEVVPFASLSPNSRVAFPLVMAVISWVTYNYQGIRKHGSSAT